MTAMDHRNLANTFKMLGFPLWILKKRINSCCQFRDLLLVVKSDKFHCFFHGVLTAFDLKYILQQTKEQRTLRGKLQKKNLEGTCSQCATDSVTLTEPTSQRLVQRPSHCLVLTMTGS